jgi:hypothetical protein
MNTPNTGLRAVQKATCVAVEQGNNVIASFVGPDAQRNADRFIDPTRTDIATSLGIIKDRIANGDGVEASGLLIEVFNTYMARRSTDPRATSPEGEMRRAEQAGCTLSELQQIAKRGPHITPDDVRDIAAMPRDELQRRALRSRDWHGHFSHSLDGIPAIRNMPGAAPDGCWSHREVRAVVEGLLAKLAAPQGGAS